MNHFELPLVFFTVFCQWGVGSVLALTLTSLLEPSMFEEGVKSGKIGKAAIFFCAITLLGSFMSLQHLGVPSEAYRALSGLSVSWLSREALIVLALNAAMLAWAATFTFAPDNSGLLRILGLTASAIGIAAILITSQVYYQMPLHPLWNTPLTYLNFLGSALLLGFAGVSLLFGVGNAAEKKLPSFLWAGVAGGGLLLLVVLAGYGAGLGAEGRMFESARLLFSSALFPGFLLFAALLPALLAALLYRRSSIPAMPAVVFMLVLLGSAISSRMLFYGSVMQQQPWF